jgi:hypothetical protein
MDSSKNTIDHQFYRNTVGIFRRNSMGNKSIGPVNCGLRKELSRCVEGFMGSACRT